MPNVIDPAEFLARLQEKVEPYRGLVRSVCGPGRSGAVASVYASYALGVPWLPYQRFKPPEALQPTLIIDSARVTGRNMRRCSKFIDGPTVLLWLWDEPPNVRFWYEFARETMGDEQFATVRVTGDGITRHLCTQCGGAGALSEFYASKPPSASDAQILQGLRSAAASPPLEKPD